VLDESHVRIPKPDIIGILLASVNRCWPVVQYM